MKKVILLLLFIPHLVSGQIFDDFESGSVSGWTQSVDGRWKADTTASISGNYSLHHVFDNPSGGSDCIGLSLTDLHPAEGTTKWTFMIRHGYDPSASNNWSAWLMSDTGPESFAGGAQASGFAAGVNLTGYDDTLRLWKINKGSISAIASCPVNWQYDIGITDAVKLVIERSSGGSWNIMVTDIADDFLGSASVFDPALFNALWMVLNYRYSSTRDRLFWFDDLKIEGLFYEDIIPPEIAGCRVTGENSIELTLSEEPSDDLLLLSNYSLNDSEITPVNVIKKSSLAIEICFEMKFINKAKNRLTINKLCDRSGNCTDSVVIEFTPLRADPGDVIISEIMADPLPVVSLPGKEFLEIFNRTDFSFNIKNWSLATESQKTVIPPTEINGGEYLILCSASDISLFAEYGNVTGLKSFPALTDEGRMICISDSMGNLIHGLEYSSKWYGNNLKANGGWSLEIIDTSYPFYTEGNWEASSSKEGGTPGAVNSAQRRNPDENFYGIENVFPEDSITINISFSETLIDLDKFPNVVLIDYVQAESISLSDQLKRKFIIRPAEALKKGKIYTLFLSPDICDFSGNEINHFSFSFGLPEQARKGDIVFNEILFNPKPDNPDYIEFFNSSEKVLNASGLYLASISTQTGDTSSPVPVSSENRCILPGSFYVVTTDRTRVISSYPVSCEENIFSVSSLPSMPDDRGHLLLLNREMELIDEVIYSDEMHFSLLDDDEGVSLEKVRPEILSTESRNWHSASESSGWGTPGAENSVFSPSMSAGDRISFSSGRISPDNNGYEDVLVIDLDPEGTDNIVTITIFDETGRYINRIAENYLAGEKASFFWDATSDDSSLVKSGIYIVFIELYTDKGKVKSWKKVCTVVR